ncbi:hypothetical protein [Mucilaginibacter phyllosphaerae]|uniref:Uncharacterized protein n=1 Tax=Mucilaginibacter phyllosphaerae TaxID=1812349 RepID=A0A4Y8A602_9SPHI|nr:hypothetical protein [Mucilaginibacter phyllosphaerae]MBB3971038.1 hypothetical protein [Mucilaginibacter phyllosphaerae]TEW63779.1 hypothetical protein E2R65_18600 [Mucilaginibacter phyllosphaerae]GGH22112.1 hypothetical protein GCM10007352_35210 [Mucilaginibacter phyllosphaerae]
MWDKLTVKKEYLLTAGVFVLLLISYQLAFKKTIALWTVHKELQKNLSLAGDVSVQPGYLKRKGHNLESISQLYKADSATFRNSIISTVSITASKENVRLLEVPAEDPFYKTDKFSIQKLVFQGDYFALLKTLQKLQQSSQIGVIRSAAIKLPEKGRTGDLKMPVLEVLFLSAR